MGDSIVQNTEIAFSSAVREAVHDFATALAETAEFRAFEQAQEQLRQDEAAQKAIDAYQLKLHSLQALLRLNAVTFEDRAELEHLRRAALRQPSLIEYSRAEETLKRLCQTVGDSISARIGLDFAGAACAGGCC